MTDREDAHRSQTQAATDMDQTKHALPAHTRADVRGIRNARLADRMDLMHQATQAHGQGKGPRGMALHTRGDDVVDAAEDAMDLLAERVVQVGGTAAGTIQGATARTGLHASPLTLAEERDHGEARASARGVDTSLWCVQAHRGSIRSPGDQPMPVMASQAQPTTTGKEGS